MPSRQDYARVDSDDQDEDTPADRVRLLSKRYLVLALSSAFLAGVVLASLVAAMSNWLSPKQLVCDEPGTAEESERCLEKRRVFFRQVTSDMPLELQAKQALFEQFLAKHERDYHKNLDVAEYRKRLLVFNQTLQTIAERNAAELRANPDVNRAVHGVTKYADWTPAEFSALLGGKPPSTRRLDIKSWVDKEKTQAGQGSAPGVGPPCTKQWLYSGSVRNQGQCGDCWTYSVTETIRTAYMQQHGSDPGPLSTQFIVDCMTKTKCSTGVNGCCGGNTMDALKWIAEQGGIPTAKDYGDYYNKSVEGIPNLRRLQTEKQVGPVSVSGAGFSYSGNHPTEEFECKSGIPKTVNIDVGPGTALPQSEIAMAEHVCSTGWVSIMLDATTWSTYTGGVISAVACGAQVNHAVVAVGLDAAKKAWLIQNSWGPDWGITKDGNPAPTNKYSNCDTLAGPSKSGCSKRLTSGETVSEACQVSCGDATVPNGGFVYVQYGLNACDLTCEPVIVTEVSKASN